MHFSSILQSYKIAFPVFPGNVFLSISKLDSILYASIGFDSVQNT